MKRGKAFPTGWTLKKLGDLGVFSKGKGIVKEELSATGLPCIRYGEIYTTHDFTIKRFRSFISRKVAMESERIYRNDILFAGSGETLEEIGKAVAYTGNEEAYAGGDVVILRIKNGAHAEYLSYALNTNIANRQKRRLGQGHSVVHIYGRDLAELRLPLPSAPEQRKIALILSTWDRAIEKTEQLIAQKQLLKKGLMQQLLTGKVRFKEFVKSKKVARTKLRLIPEDWSEARLANCVTKVGSGVTPNGGEAVYKSTGRVFVRSQNIGHGNLLLEDVAFIDEDTHQSFPSTEIFEFDVLLNITGASIGRCAVADNRLVGGNVNQHVCIIRVNQTLDPHFLAVYLLSEFGQNQIDSFQAGGNRQGLNFEQIKSFRVPLPSTREQRRISAVMRDADREIEQLIGTQKKLQSQKKGLMQQLLTGKVRVKI